MAKDDFLVENPHQTYNNQFQGLEQTGKPLPGTKKVKQKNHPRQVKTPEGLAVLFICPTRNVHQSY